MHPLCKSIGPLLDDLILDHPLLKNCAPFVLAHMHLIPSADYSTRPPPPALPLYVRSRLRVTLTPPFPATPGELSPITPRPGTDIFATSMNATREAMEATGHAFVAIGATMDVRKWSWPGYLTFNKGALSKAAPPQDVPPDTENSNSSEERPVEAATDGIADEPVPTTPEAGLRGEVDRESLHEAISTDGREFFHEEGPRGEENAAAAAEGSTSHTGEMTAVEDDKLQMADDTSLDEQQDEQDLPPPASPSTLIVRLPDLTSSPSLSSSQSTLPAPIPPPSFRSFYLHLSPNDAPLNTVPRRVLFLTVSERAF